MGSVFIKTRGRLLHRPRAFSITAKLWIQIHSLVIRGLTHPFVSCIYIYIPVPYANQHKDKRLVDSYNLHVGKNRKRVVSVSREKFPKRERGISIYLAYHHEVVGMFFYRLWPAKSNECCPSKESHPRGGGGGSDLVAAVDRATFNLRPSTPALLLRRR